MRNVEGSSPIVDSVRGPALEWVTGKAKMDAAEAFDMLAASEVVQEWIPGASRRVAAALSKANVARKLYKRYGKELEAIGDYTIPSAQRGWEVSFLLQFGNWRRGSEIDFETILRNSPSDEIAKVVEEARSFAHDFEPLIGLIEILDATRPAPVFTLIGASPTVTRLLTSLGFSVDESTIRTPPIEWVVVERLDKSGKPYLVKVGYIKWPRGTIHNGSRYAGGTAQNDQCHACGHAIRNSMNWVPLLLDNNDGVPYSLWVGRDCARTLFGIDVKGDIELEEVES